MTAEELRKRAAGPFETVDAAEIVCVLTEIAAQLADLNYRLSGQGATVGSRAQVDAVLCASNDDIPVNVRY